MLPNTENLNELILKFGATDQNKTQTFAINTTENIMGGRINGLDALKQSIYLMLSIEEDQHIIYPYTYGIKKSDLMGKPIDYVMAIIPERISEALLSDDRITKVSNFEFVTNKNTLHVSFIVNTIYGTTNAETMVRY